MWSVPIFEMEGVSFAETSNRLPSMNPVLELSPSKHVDSLIADISKLMAEAEGMLSESTSHAEVYPELFYAQREVTGPGLATRYASARAKLAEAGRRADGAIRNYPYEAIAVALGFGVLLGACAIRRRQGV